MPPHYIAVEGPIGVGKTTVVEKLAERLDANKVLEDWATNPFLQPFYEGSDGASFQLELFFLLMRYRQQQELGGLRFSCGDPPRRADTQQLRQVEHHTGH